MPGERIWCDVIFGTGFAPDVMPQLAYLAWLQRRLALRGLRWEFSEFDPINYPGELQLCFYDDAGKGAMYDMQHCEELADLFNVIPSFVDYTD